MDWIGLGEQNNDPCPTLNETGLFSTDPESKRKCVGRMQSRLRIRFQLIVIVFKLFVFR